MSSNGLLRGEHQIVGSSDFGDLQIRRHAVVAQVLERVAAGAIIHEIARAALQGLDVLDVRPGCPAAAISPSSRQRGSRRREIPMAIKTLALSMSRDPFRHRLHAVEFRVPGHQQKESKIQNRADPRQHRVDARRRFQAAHRQGDERCDEDAPASPCRSVPDSGSNSPASDPARARRTARRPRRPSPARPTPACRQSDGTARNMA